MPEHDGGDGAILKHEAFFRAGGQKTLVDEYHGTDADQCDGHERSNFGGIIVVERQHGADTLYGALGPGGWPRESRIIRE